MSAVSEGVTVVFQVSVLHQACCAKLLPSSSCPAILSSCLEVGAEVNVVDSVGQTPLFYAVTHCQAGQLLPLLLGKGEASRLRTRRIRLSSVFPGAKVNQQRWSDHWTALHLAAMLGHLGTVQILVRAGANSRMEDSQGQTPADIATRFGFPEVARECCDANREKFKRERQIRRPDQESSLKKKRTFEENIEAASHHPDQQSENAKEDVSESFQVTSQMSSVINNEQKQTRIEKENCSRGKGVNKKFGN